MSSSFVLEKTTWMENDGKIKICVRKCDQCLVKNKICLLTESEPKVSLCYICIDSLFQEYVSDMQRKSETKSIYM